MQSFLRGLARKEVIRVPLKTTAYMRGRQVCEGMLAKQFLSWLKLINSSHALSYPLVDFLVILSILNFFLLSSSPFSFLKKVGVRDVMFRTLLNSPAYFWASFINDWCPVKSARSMVEFAF